MYRLNKNNINKRCIGTSHENHCTPIPSKQPMFRADKLLFFKDQRQKTTINQLLSEHDIMVKHVVAVKSAMASSMYV